MKTADPYKGKLPSQSWFSFRYATWANNHNGRAKAKRYNKRVAKRKLKQEFQKKVKEENYDSI